MSDEYKKSTPQVRPVYNEDTGRVLAPDNKEVDESREHREGPAVPTPSKADPSIFLEGGNAHVSSKTPAEAGITVTLQSGPVKWSERKLSKE